MPAALLVSLHHSSSSIRGGMLSGTSLLPCTILRVGAYRPDLGLSSECHDLHTRHSIDDVVRHVLNKQVLIEVSVLCDFVERLCGRLIVLRRYQKTSTFNGVTLPKSWIVNIMKDFTRDPGDKKDTRLQPQSVSVLVGMLRRIYTGTQAGEGSKTTDVHRSARC